jgi:hypothetical protein
LKRVKPQLGCEELRLVTRFVLESLSHDLVCRLAKRRGLAKGKDTHDWQAVEKTRTLYKKLDAEALAVLLFEAILLGAVGNTNSVKDDDLLGNAAVLVKLNVKALRSTVAKEEKGERKKLKTPKAKPQAK